ncbi:MAG TPA: hypothetical protein VGR81_01035 [Candidatus Acidoferrales bacterium]|nr:hypothetical protein [Candidatus Acidoferrales bacterium]
MMEVLAFSVILVLLSLLGLVWDVASGLITSGVDGILLALVCLMMGGIFSLQILYTLWCHRKDSAAGGGK